MYHPEWELLSCSSCEVPPALASRVAMWAWIWTLNRGPALNSVRKCGDEPGTHAIIVSGGIVNSADGKERDPALAKVHDCSHSYE